MFGLADPPHGKIPERGRGPSSEPVLHREVHEWARPPDLRRPPDEEWGLGTNLGAEWRVPVVYSSPSPEPGMLRTRSGFTMVELVIAIVIGSILTTVALSQISGAQTRIAVRGAKTAYASIFARARAHGIEMGENVLLRFDANGDSVWIDHGGTVLETMRFGEEQDVDLRATPTGAPATFDLCFSPRGYTDTDCNSMNSILRIEFWQGQDSTSLLQLPLGQLVGM